MDTVAFEDITVEHIPDEFMVRTRKRFHRRRGRFIGVDFSKMPKRPTADLTRDMISIAWGIRAMPDHRVEWVSFSEKAVELGVYVIGLNDRVTIAEWVVLVLEKYKYEPILKPIIFRNPNRV